MRVSYNEFHVSKAIRDICHFSERLFASSGNIVFGNLKNVRIFASKLNTVFVERGEAKKQISAGTLNAMGLLDEIFHFACMMYRKTKYPEAFSELLDDLDLDLGTDSVNQLLIQFIDTFPPVAVYNQEIDGKTYLAQEALEPETGRKRSNRESTLEELILLRLANEDPAFNQFSILFDDTVLRNNPIYKTFWTQTKSFFKKLPYWGTYGHDLITFLKEPVVFSPNSLHDQLDYVRKNWSILLGEWIKRLLNGIDILNEEEKPKWAPIGSGLPDMAPPHYENLMKEYERFSPDRDWMPNVVLIAKTVLVWLYQLSQKYNRTISRLDQIPDEELDQLHHEGFTGLWLIGLWQRSLASKTIKQRCGNPEAAASAYSLYDYDIAPEIGGWNALENLRTRLWQRGIRLASDMVPNHTGMDSKWVSENPDFFVQRADCPFPQYTFNGPDLSSDSRISIYLEDHYYSKSDCAVVFKRVDKSNGNTRYIYHGNDGTGMPWNDTAQIDFLNEKAREAVIQKILHVARNFPIIRFDAAMVLAKKHIRRLWYPEPGQGGDIATRSEYSLPSNVFEQKIPVEFWREVVDRVSKEVPDTLLLAEAFWMMEGYFTRTLGMHRVYNSAFMNMLKKEENKKYRDTVKNTIEFDPQVLKRFVNFMNNPDEETAVAQFGKGDKYFGVCTLMITMPGLPMFGHGQIEGFEEKYGMEYTRAYKDEQPDADLIKRHWHDIFPLLKKRYLFAEIKDFLFYDVRNGTTVNENIFAYSNRSGDERTIVFYNNCYDRAEGWIKESCPFAVKTEAAGDEHQLRTRSISDGLGISGKSSSFCIFREQRSSLWFIRSCNDIEKNGLYVRLNGFENQVLMDFYEEKDDEEKRWSILCSFLDGKGTPDLEIAWQELHYRELYDALGKLITPQFLEQFRLLTLTAPQRRALKLKSPQSTSVFDMIKDDVLDFYEISYRFAQLESKKNKGLLLPSPKKQFTCFKRQLKRIFRAISIAQRTILAKNTALSQDPIDRCRSSKSPAEFFFHGTSEYPDGILLFAAYALISPIAKTGYAQRWAFDRKLEEFLNKCGVRGKLIRNVYTRTFILAQLNMPVLITKKQRLQSAYRIAEELVQGKNASLLTGKNIFNEIAWFNKELSDSSLYLAVAIPMLCSWPLKRAALLRLYKKMADAKEKAEYHCKTFLDSFNQ